MTQIVVLVREVPEDESRVLTDMFSRREPHTWRTFYPYRDPLFKQGFAGGEVAFLDDDGRIVAQSIVNLRESLLREFEVGAVEP